MASHPLQIQAPETTTVVYDIAKSRHTMAVPGHAALPPDSVIELYDRKVPA